MESEPSRCCIFLIVVFYTFILSFFSINASYADQYYDPQTRRYIEVQTNTPVQKYIQLVPTQAHINAEQQRIARQKAIETQMEEEAKNTANRRFDPSRFHRTEDVGFY